MYIIITGLILLSLCLVDNQPHPQQQQQRKDNE